MAHGDALVEARKRTAEGCRRVALYENPVGLHGDDRSGDSPHELRRQIRKALLRSHDVEVDVRLELELLEHLIEHLPVLAGRYDYALGACRFSERGHDGRQLDHLGASAEHGDDSHGGAASRATRRVFDQVVRPPMRRIQAMSEATAQRYA